MDICPKCQKHIEDEDRVALESQPGKRLIKCTNCGFEGFPGRRESKGLLEKRSLLVIGVLSILVLIGFWDDIEDIFLVGIIEGEGWDRITTRVVEENCMFQAKGVAVEEGYSDLFVLGCTCLTVQSDILKTFDCDVDTIDILNPKRKVIVHCYKLRDECTIASDRGIETYTFEELEEYIR